MNMKGQGMSGSSPVVWDHAARNYDQERSGDPVYISCIKQLAKLIPSGVRCCLDAGCGTGLSTAYLSPKCDLVVAVDYSFSSLQELQNKGLPNVFAVQADINQLPFKTSTFDACACANTLQHFRPNGPQQQAAAELARVTEDQGVIAISVHHYSVTKRKAGWIKEGKPGQPGIDYIFRFSASDLWQLLPGASLTSAGYYNLLKIPFLGRRYQDFFATCFGRLARISGHGHMLIAYYRKRADSRARKIRYH